MAIATETDVLTPTELVQAHQAGIWRYLRYLGATDSAAEDLAQETFIEMVSRPFEQRSHHETASYLRTIARHQFLRARRREGRSVSLDEVEIAEEIWNRLASDGGDELLDALDDCLEHINGRARKAIDLHYREESSREEIARQLEMKPDGVKTLLRRARATLRECVERRVDQNNLPKKGFQR